MEMKRQISSYRIIPNYAGEHNSPVRKYGLCTVTSFQRIQRGKWEQGDTESNFMGEI